MSEHLLVTYLWRDDVLIYQVPGENLHNLYLLFGGQSGDCRLKHAPDTCLVDSNETRIIHKGNGTHDELAIHSVRHTSVTRDRIAEVLDLKGAFEARGEEATEWCDQRSECCENEYVELNRSYRKGSGEIDTVGKRNWKRILLRNEDRVGVALQTGVDVGPQIL
jgi:hypothetical protein